MDTGTSTRTGTAAAGTRGVPAGPAGRGRPVVITPAKADLFQRCPLSYERDQAGPREEGRGPGAAAALERGRYHHRLLERYNLARGRAADPAAPLARAELERLVAAAPPPPALAGGDRAGQAATDLALETLAGWQEVLADQGLGAAVDPERYIRTAPRPVRGQPGMLVAFAGRVDALAWRDPRTLVALDAKATFLPDAGDLAAAASSLVYTLLLRYAYPLAETVEILQVVPHARRAVSCVPGPADVERGTALCRAMVAAAGGGAYPPVVGAHCSYCPYVSRCPAHRRRVPGWEAAL